MVDRIWKFFCSLHLTLANLFGLFLAMIAGTFVNPSNAAFDEIEKAFAGRPFVLWSYRTFELYDLFHSWWFTLLLVSLSLNLIACSIERLPRIWLQIQHPEKRLDKVQGLRLRLPKISSDADVPGALRAAGYKVEVAERDGGLDVFAERGRYARLGVWVVHLSLLVVLGGGIVGRLTAFEGMAQIPQAGGEADAMVVRRPDGSTYRKKFGFTVRCDDFRLQEFEPGRPKAFESDLVVVSPDGREVARKTINVNHPLQYGGLTFYQASYNQLEEEPRAAITLTDKATGKKRDLLVAGGESFEAADGVSYQVVDHNPDFAGLGEAVRVVRTLDGAQTSFWVFARAPSGFDARNRDDRFAFSFQKLRPMYATGLQVARDPSTPIIYLGCFLLFSGVAVAFGISHKRVWARVENGSVTLGAAAHRNADGFRLEFDKLCAGLGLPKVEQRKAA